MTTESYGDVQAAVELALGAALPDLAAALVAADAQAWPVDGTGPAGAIRCAVVPVDDGSTWWEVQRRVAVELQAAGGEVLWGERLARRAGARDARRPAHGRDLLRLDVGRSGRATHTLVLYNRATARPEVRWGQDPQTNAWRQLRAQASGPVVALVIDDLGYRQDGTSGGFLSLDAPLTLSVLPGLAYSRRFALEATELVLPPGIGDGGRHESAVAERLAAGCPVTLGIGPDPSRSPQRRREILLHLPMQPDGYPAVDPGSRAVLIGMSGESIGALLDDCLQSLPGVRGVNNHMGSAATADEPTMQALMAELKARDLLFLDSLTTAASVAYRTARAAGLPAVRNRIFLDHDHQDDERIRRNLHSLVESARTAGFGVGIGHPHPATLQVLSQELPRLQAAGVVFVTLSELLALQVDRGQGGG